MCFSDIIFSGCSDVTGNLKKYLRIHFFFNFFFVASSRYRNHAWFHSASLIRSISMSAEVPPPPPGGGGHGAKEIRPVVKQTNHKRHLVSACFALGSCAGCSNMPVRSLTRTRRRRRATGRVTKRGIRQERRPSLARRVGIAHSPAATARRREDRAPFASLSDWFEKQHRKARGCSQQTT